MAWQTPKTNWSASDGVRDSDFNRIEENILAIYNGAYGAPDRTVYVRTSGTDAPTSGDSSSPCLTINYALSLLPRNLNGKTVQVNIGSGTYNEAVVIRGFSNGKLILMGPYNTEIAVNSLEIDSSICLINSIAVIVKPASLASYGVKVTNGATLIASGRLSISNVINAISVDTCSACHCASSVSVGSVSNGIEVGGASRMHLTSLAGSTSSLGFIAEEGSIISYSTSTLTADGTLFISRTGGRILSGVQTAIPNY